jgi:hypothetical protein
MMRKRAAAGPLMLRLPWHGLKVYRNIVWLNEIIQDNEPSPRRRTGQGFATQD